MGVEQGAGKIKKSRGWCDSLKPGACREGFTRFIKPLPAAAHSTAPFPREGVLRI